MGLGEASLNIIGKLGPWIDFPVVLNPNQSNPPKNLIASPKFDNLSLKERIHRSLFIFGRGRRQQSSSIRAIWYLGNGTLLLSIFYVIGRIAQLSLQLKHGTIQPTVAVSEEYVEMLVGGAMIAQTLVTWYSVENNPTLFCFVNNELFAKLRIHNIGWPSRQRLPDLGEALGYYGTVVGFTVFPLLGTGAAILRDYDIMNKLILDFEGYEGPLGFLGNKFVRKSLAALVMTGLCTFGAILCGCFLLSLLQGSMCITEIAKRNLEMSQEMNGKSNREPLDKITGGLDIMFQKWLRFLINLWDKRSSKVTPNDDPDHVNEAEPETRMTIDEIFRERYLLHNQLVMLVDGTNQSLGVYMPTVEAIGLIIIVTANFAMITLYDKLEAFLTAGVILVSLGVSAVSVFFLTYTALPNSLTEETIHVWRGRRLGPVERRQVRAMRVATLSAGNFFTFTEASTMDFLDTVMNQTVTAITL